ncbi:extensin [Iris pallida]|uniref:Extensin n=1 Tax=Iris pallida TaxID=29817 RepID=A0AAX6FW47_IRIPA|nr:extensin [Iris pallida]
MKVCGVGVMFFFFLRLVVVVICGGREPVGSCGVAERWSRLSRGVRLPEGGRRSCDGRQQSRWSVARDNSGGVLLVLVERRLVGIW